MNMPSKKGQTTDVLITYGWALVILATMVGLLAFIASGGINTSSCTTYLHFICKGVGFDEDTLILILQNATGQEITINPFIGIGFDGLYYYGVIEYQGQEYRFEDVTIKPGTEFTIQGMGRATAKQISITYVEQATGLTRTVESSLSTDAPDDIEISNDGIDNDGDGQIDCADTPTNCQYLVTVTGPTGTSITPITLTFNSEAVNNLLANGNWNIKTAYIYFYATNVSGGEIKATIGPSQSTNDITAGWNSVEISGLTWDLSSSNITITASSGSFTIEGTDSANAPKLVIVLEESGGGM